MKPGEPEPFDSSFASASGDADDAPKQFGKNKRAVAAVKPGAVAVKPGEPEPFDSSFASASGDADDAQNSTERVSERWQRSTRSRICETRRTRAIRLFVHEGKR